MGCINSKTKKKAKERDTLSQEGARQTAKEQQEAAEDQLASRQNTSALQAAGIQSRDGADRLSSLIAADPEALEVPVPAHTSAPSSPAEDIINTTAKPAEAPKSHTAVEDKAKAALRGGSLSTSSGPNITPDRGSDAATPTSPALSEARNKKKKREKKKKGKHDHKHGKNSKKNKSASHSESASVALSAGHSVSHKDSPPVEPPQQRPTSSRSRLQTRLTSTSGSSLSFEFESDAAPSAEPAVAAQPSWSASGGVVSSSSIAVSSSRLSADAGSRQRANMTAAKITPATAAAAGNGESCQVPSPHAMDAFQDAASAAISADASRVPYEPYPDLSGHGGFDGDDDRLPPYEWAPRTMLIPSPLRHDNTTSTAWLSGEAEAGLDMQYRGAYEALAQPSYNAVPAFSNGRDTAAAAAPSVHFHDPNADDVAATDSALLMPRTFYPHLPPVSWSSYGSRPPPDHSAAYGPSSKFYNDSDTGTSVSVEEDVNSGTPEALYSPPDHAYGRAAATRSRVVAAPPSLVDAYVSDDDGYAEFSAPPPPPPPAPPQPKITVLPSPYTYGPSPMVAADAPYYDGYGIVRSNAGHAVYGGVSAHQYKPVTYLFDNSMDNWMHTRRMPAPQRELYADAADLW